MPPFGVRFIAPMLQSTQLLLLIETAVALKIVLGSEIVTVSISVQPFLSVTVTVYSPAFKLETMAVF